MTDPVTIDNNDRNALERVVLATLKEQRSARHWRNAWRIVWLLLIIGVITVAFRKEGNAGDQDGPHTAVIRIDGEIAAGTQSSAENIVVALNNAVDDNATKAIVLLINSPGGSPVQAGIVYDEIRRLEKKKKIPIYAVVEDLCASGAYYIASATDQIFVNKASMVGSIGVIMEGFGFTDVMKKIGIDRRVLTAGSNKDLMDPFSPQTPAQINHLQSMLNQVHQQFIDAVETGRGKRLKVNTPELFSGLVWTGQTAIQLGLADHYGSLDYVARDVAKAPTLVDYTQTDNVAMRLAKRFGLSAGQGFAFELTNRHLSLH